MDSTTQIINIIYIIACFGLAFYVFFKNRKLSINRNFAYMTLALGGWAWSLLLFYQKNPENILFLGRVNFVFTQMISYFAFFFGYVFPVKTFKIKKSILALVHIFFFSLFTITLFTDHIGADEKIVGDEIITTFGTFYPIFSISFIVFMTLLFILPLKKFKKLNLRQKQQVKYLVTGAFLSFLVSLVTCMILPAVFKIYTFQIYGPLGLSFFFVFTAYAILKYRLLDIKVIVQLSLVYTFLLSIVTGLFLTINFVIGLIFHFKTESYAISALLTTFIGVFGVPPLEKFFQKKTDKIFFKYKYDYSEAMARLSKTLNKNINLEKLLTEIIQNLFSIIKPSSAMIWIKEQRMIINDSQKTQAAKNELISELQKIANPNFPGLMLVTEIDILIEKNLSQKEKNFLLKTKSFLEKNNFVLALPLKSADKFIGIIFMGKKLSEEQFSGEDIKLLTTFSHQAAVAIEKAQLYDKEIHYSENLEKEVKNRTKKIKRLQENQKNLMVDVSHNLQTPLTIIRCELEQLQSEFPKNKNLKDFEKTIDKLSHFIYDLLRFAQLDSGKIKLNKQKYNLSEQGKDLAEYYQIMFKEKNIKIITDIEKNIFVVADMDRIEETITNIMSNAYKYIGQNKQVKIAIKKTAKNCSVSINDNGPGISDEDLQKVFKRFFRSEAPDGTKGNGLGLSFCKKIIELHKGTIKAKSRLGQGTSFTITLPRA